MFLVHSFSRSIERLPTLYFANPSVTELNAGEQMNKHWEAGTEMANPLPLAFSATLACYLTYMCTPPFIRLPFQHTVQMRLPPPEN